MIKTRKLVVELFVALGIFAPLLSLVPAPTAFAAPPPNCKLYKLDTSSSEGTFGRSITATDCTNSNDEQTYTSLDGGNTYRANNMISPGKICTAIITLDTSNTAAATFAGTIEGKRVTSDGENCESFAKTPITAKTQNGNTAPPPEQADAADAAEGPVCSAGMLGWVLCPMAEALVAATEGIASLLEELLIFQPLLSSDQGKAIQAIWSSLLVIANVGLVIAVLMIVFSQATSVGLSNYGVKKLLPRVFAAAILMNLSFYICAAAVDLSNILGVSVKAIVEAGLQQLPPNPNISPGAGVGATIAVSVTALLAVAIAAATGAIFMVLPLLVSGLMAAFTALIVIAARQVLITLLIIVAPLAILAWILPNTDEWFTKWRKLFTALLLMFPIIMMIFYGSVLMYNIILTAAGNSGGANDLIIQLLAFLVLTVPLFSLPFIMKMVGGVLERFGAIVNNRNKGLTDRSRNWAKGQSQRTREKNAARLAGARWGENQQGMKGRLKRGVAQSARFGGGYGARRDFKRSQLKMDAERIQQNEIAERLQSDSSKLAAASTLRGETGQAIARARGVQIQDKAIGEEVGAAKTLIENMQFTNTQLTDLAVKGTATNDANRSLTGDFYQKAAQQQFISTGQTAKVHSILENVENMSEDVRETLSYNIQQNYSTLKAKDHTLNFDDIKSAVRAGKPIYDIQTTDRNGEKVVQSSILMQGAVANLSGVTKEVMAGQDARGLASLRNAIENNVGDPGKRAKAIEVVQDTISDAQLYGKLSADSKREFNAIIAAAGLPPVPPPNISGN